MQCHGAGGKGDGPMSAQSPVPLADFTQAAFVETRSPQAVFDFISNGNLDNLMPPWKDSLSQAEIWDLTAYVWSLHLSEADLSGGAAAYGENCASCHGAEGEGGSEGPALGSADGLSTTETEWWGLQSASTHPAVAGADVRLLPGGFLFYRVPGDQFAAPGVADFIQDFRVLRQVRHIQAEVHHGLVR